MGVFEDKLNKYVDRSNSFTKKLDLKRTVLHCLDIQNLCLNPKGADYIESVAGAPSAPTRWVRRSGFWISPGRRASRSLGRCGACVRTEPTSASTS